MKLSIILIFCGCKIFDCYTIVSNFQGFLDKLEKFASLTINLEVSLFIWVSRLFCFSGISRYVREVCLTHYKP